MQHCFQKTVFAPTAWFGQCLTRAFEMRMCMMTMVL